MGGFDDHVGIIGDWMAPSTCPSPSPRSFFLSMLSEAGSASVTEPPKNNPTSGFTFHGPDKQFGSENDAFGEQKAASSRSGLVERMAARAGYNAPRLNTHIIRPADVDKQASVLTIPPGLSPTSLLDSPVFLSNSLAQPSPTTGKLPFAQNKDDLFEEFNASSFAFKPVPESASVSVSNKVNPPFMSWQSENRLPSQSIETAKNCGLNGKIVQEHHEEDADQIPSGENGNFVSEDGYNWRKYGQKQVKGSEYPRSYYKCTYTNCPVTKKVERSHEGHITEIIYKGAHNHPKPPPSRRSGFGSSNDVQGGTEWAQDGNLEVSSTAVHHGTQVDSADVSLTFSNEEEGEDDDRATHGSVSLCGDGEGDESESKRRKVEAYATDVSGASRAIREPRVVVQTTSEVDVLDDGYRWRKYGQKVVKGNPNPRSYYKCTSAGCTVRKHVERASHDLKSVITTYEGKHNHDVPAARNSSHVNSTINQPQSVQASQVPNNMARFERPHYGLQPGPSGYGYGMNLAQMAMAGLGPNQAKMPIPGHQFIGQMNGMGMMLPKGEPKVEPVSDPGLNLAANGSSVYHHQIINGLPLGP